MTRLARLARLALLALLGGCDKLFDLTAIPIPDAPPPCPVVIASMQLELIAGSYNGGLAIPREAHFDHFNVCPTR